MSVRVPAKVPARPGTNGSDVGVRIRGFPGGGARMDAKLSRRMGRLMVLMLVCLGLAASGSACQTEPGPQVVTGTVALSTFPGPVAAVYVVQAGGPTVRTLIGPDGTFSLTIPPGRGYRIEFLAAGGRPGLVFPRRAGDVGSAFDVRGGVEPFDLGRVRYVGNPQLQTYAFLSTSDGTGEADVECEDGIDAATGAVCVDDEDEEGAGVCDEEDDDEDDDEDYQCEDGFDPTTGTPCAEDPGGEPDGECVDGFDALTGAPCVDDDAEELPTDAAVADHNLPPSIGCDEEEDDD